MDQEDGVAPAPGERLLPRFIRAEANLLRLPLFALHTKGLRTLDGIECKGSVTRDGQTHSFSLRATRNADTPYPGPLARAAHLAFLSIATEQRLPLENPIAWSWRDLCRRMGTAYSGQTVRELKRAVRSTALLGLRSEYAIYSKAERRLLRGQQELLHLYERVAFVGAELPGGQVADRNYLWFADWYLQNLNALFTAPLDYELWRYLDRRSPIASRLYEFLLLNFHGGAPVLRINYPNLAQFLPVRPERYLSLARAQMGPALGLLTGLGVIAAATWAKGKGGDLQVSLYRGERLAAPRGGGRPPRPLLDMADAFTGAIAVKELRHANPPGWDLVADFYRLWAGVENARPSKKELAQAAELVACHGQAKAKALIPLVVQRLKERWPEAKTFGAAGKYLPDVTREYDRRQRRQAQEDGEQLRQDEEREQASRLAAERAARRRQWQALSPAEQEDIRRAVLAGQPKAVLKFPGIIERFCLEELGRRQGLSQASPN